MKEVRTIGMYVAGWLIFLVCFTHPARSADESARPASSVNPLRLLEDVMEQEGMFYLPSVEFPSSRLRKTEAERIFREASDQRDFKTAAATGMQLAWDEFQNGKGENAVTYLHLVTEAFQQLQDFSSAAEAMLYTGYVQYKLLNYDLALSRFNDALQEYEKAGDISGVAVSNAFIGQVYLVKKDYTESVKFFLKAVKDPDQTEIATSAHIEVQIAELLIRNNDFTGADSHLEKAEAVFTRLNDRNGLAMVYRDRGIIRFKKGDYQEAIALYRKSLAMSEQLSVAKLLKDTYLKLFIRMSVSGEHEKSNEYNIIYVQMRDSIDQVERSRILNSQLTRRDIMEREAVSEMLRKGPELSLGNLSAGEIEKNRQLIEEEIERLEKEKIIEDLNMAKRVSDQSNLEREERIQQLTRQKEMQDLALSQKELEVSKGNSLRNMLLVAVAFIIIIAVLMYNRYRQKHKSHQELDKAYKELSETHQKLIAAQEQLVHSQKMASLGQLTAGIAHEIQNPLNFVNNFAELSVELVEELRENGVDTKQILDDLSANLQKINSHGKRADKIVKGMLTHSRSGQEEKTAGDINKMIDELLELSYHGNRTRDNAFTAEIVKNYDTTLPPVHMVTQDISRVLINLFNNAFYAVGQLAKTQSPGYKPRVGVSTQREDDQVVIKIRDNGPGIPEDLKEKIFDPFFTTKPAGEGTGLGLSLSYDIVTKGHHGKLTVSSEKNNFTEFTIVLPINPTSLI